MDNIINNKEFKVKGEIELSLQGLDDLKSILNSNKRKGYGGQTPSEVIEEVLRFYVQGFNIDGKGWCD